MLTRYLRSVNVSVSRPTPRRYAGSRTPSSYREELALRIASLRPGDRLPPEPTLAAELGVSRSKLRETLRSLEDHGLLVRTPGRGTVVSHRAQLRNDLSVNTGVTELIRANGLSPATRDLKVEQREAREDEARELEVDFGTVVCVINRVRTADGRPVVDSRDVIPAHLLAGASVSEAVADGSLYESLSELGHNIAYGVARIRPTTADTGTARRLGVPVGTLLLSLVQTDFDIRGRPVVLSYEHHLTDAIDVIVVRRGPIIKTAP